MSSAPAVRRKEDLLPLREGDRGEAVADLQERLEQTRFRPRRDDA